MIGETDQAEAWLRQLRGGDPQALARLFGHFRPRLHRMVQLRLDTRAARRIDPSDVLQEVYVDAELRVQRYLQDPTVVFYIWLRGLTSDRLLMLHRRHLDAECRAAGRECALPADSSIALAGRLFAQQSSPSRALMREELQQRVEGALNRLAPHDREMILMRHFEDMSNAEIAQMLGLSDSAASMRYGRAVFRLKEILSADLSSD